MPAKVHDYFVQSNLLFKDGGSFQWQKKQSNLKYKWLSQVVKRKNLQGERRTLKKKITDAR